MSDQDNLIALLEEYILETDKEKILETLVPDSVPYLIIKLTNDIQKHGLNLEEQSFKDLQQLLQKSDSNRTTEMIALRNLLNELSIAKSKDKKERIQNILYLLNQNLFGFGFEFTKPASLNQASGNGLKDENQVELESKLDTQSLSYEISKEGILDRINRIKAP
jgi:hypothetical protein